MNRQISMVMTGDVMLGRGVDESLGAPALLIPGGISCPC